MYIYADNAGTTKMSPVAIDAMTKCMNEVLETIQPAFYGTACS